MCPVDYTAFAVSGKVWIPLTGFTWVAIVIKTSRLKSISNCCVFEVFGGVCVLSRSFLGFCCGRRFFLS